ncbi:MAG: NADH-quinone oxidoreductase subunit N, partial [Dehalococcoidia bacterium]
MGIGARDLYLVSPALSLAVLAAVVLLADLFIGRKRWVLVIAVAGLIVPMALGISLWSEVHDEGAQLAFNGSLMVDKFALFFTFLIVGIVALVFVSGEEYTERFRPYQSEFLGLVLFSATGLVLLSAAADLITIYVSLELASLPVVALAAFSKTQMRSTEAGVKYLVLSAVSSAVLLYGFAFLYGAAGTVQVVSLDPSVPTIAQMVPTTHDSLPFGNFAVLVAVVMATAGFGFKLSMVPFQMWTPDVYEGAPTPVGAFLAVASKAAAFAVVLRLFYGAFGNASADWAMMFAVLAAVTMSVGNVVAISQSNVKRLLGYSTIAQAGYMLIGVAAVAARSQEAGDSALGIASVLFYLGGYAAMNLTAFFAIIAITNRTNDESIDGLAGVARRSPLLAALLTFSLLSLTGIPPTVGFMGKLFLFNAAVNADLAWLAVIGVVNSAVSAYYYLSIVRVM